MTQNGDTPVVIVERRNSGFGAFLGGAIVGAVVALLYAPKTGEETKAEIRDRVKQLRDEAEDRLHLMRDDVEDRYHRVRDDVEDRVERVRGDIGDRVDTAREDLRLSEDPGRRGREGGPHDGQQGT